MVVGRIPRSSSGYGLQRSSSWNALSGSSAPGRAHIQAKPSSSHHDDKHERDHVKVEALRHGEHPHLHKLVVTHAAAEHVKLPGLPQGALLALALLLHSLQYDPRMFHVCAPAPADLVSISAGAAESDHADALRACKFSAASRISAIRRATRAGSTSRSTVIGRSHARGVAISRDLCRLAHAHRCCLDVAHQAVLVHLVLARGLGTSTFCSSLFRRAPAFADLICFSTCTMFVPRYVCSLRRPLLS